jgi:hypothetical protein
MNTITDFYLWTIVPMLLIGVVSIAFGIRQIINKKLVLN